MTTERLVRIFAGAFVLLSLAFGLAGFVIWLAFLTTTGLRLVRTAS